MGRPNKSAERREDLLPLIAAEFAATGYRRTTTSALARRCALQETILYRLWPDKKAMFLAAIDHVFARSLEVWGDLLRADAKEPTAAERILAHEAEHHGEWGLYRILFAGLSETDDAEILERLRSTYRAFQRFVRDRIAEHREARRSNEGAPDPELAAWALLGLGTITSIGRELDLLPAPSRKRLLKDAGRLLLEGTS
jgi:AcrR family transcriptional regulator